MDETKRRALLVKLVFVILLVGGGIVVWFAFSRYWATRLENAIIKNQNNAYWQSLIENNPAPLQNLFVEDVKTGKNTKLTKSAVYFITHRYFDNGGNIYEIYDYVNSHPELVFLKEAEAIYPSTFKKIAEGTAPSTYSGYGMHAFLAYLEVLDKYGYADVAALGTLANQYAKIADDIKKAPEQLPPSVNVSEYLQKEINKSLLFAEKAKSDVVRIIEGEITSNDIPDRDIVVGLNQYASALRYYEALGIDFASPKRAQEIFPFSTDYAKRLVPELYVFTSFLNASTLLMVQPGATEEARSVLAPVYNLEVKKGASNGIIIDKILHSRLESPSYFPGTKVRDINRDIYGKNNVVSLAKAVPEFKAWLVSNGWEEGDFQLLVK